MISKELCIFDPRQMSIVEPSFSQTCALFKVDGAQYEPNYEDANRGILDQAQASVFFRCLVDYHPTTVAGSHP